MTRIDRAFERVRHGDRSAFAEWLQLVEGPLLRSLRPFCRAVDPEEIMQEGLMRVWVLARTMELTGENASLKYSLRLMRNLALQVARRNRLMHQVSVEAIEGKLKIEPDPPSDPGLAGIIRLCLERLPRRPRQALLARINNEFVSPDRTLAEALGMKTNTFRQNIVRARRYLAECLGRHGVDLEDQVSR